MKNNSKQGGFIRIIVLIIVVLIVLKFLGYDISSIWSNPTVVSIFTAIWNVIMKIVNIGVSLLKTLWTAIQSVVKSLTGKTI